VWSSSTTTGASPPGGGSSARSSGADRLARTFAGADELTPAAARSAPLRSLPRPSELARPLRLRGKPGKALETLGIATHGALVEHFPREHRERDARKIAELGPGEEAAVAVEVRSVSVRPMRNRRQKRVEAKVVDDSGPMVAVWFNQPWLVDRLSPGTHVLLYGQRRQRNQFWVKEFEELDGAAAAPGTGHVPMYPASEGISAQRLRQLLWEDYGRMAHTIEPLPAALRVAESLPDRVAALRGIHFPDDEHEQRGSRRRLAFEELLLLELAVESRKRARRQGRRAAPLEATGELADAWLRSLPFELTGDQEAAIVEIDADVYSEAPMERLLMGEVGAGKTMVAVHAMLRAAENGRQAAFMAPTETLAEQHLFTIDRLLGGLVPVELLTGSTSASRRRDLLGRLASGELALVVGTHALIEEAVDFAGLALVVVDEEHRFGVRQRAALDRKAPEGLTPHTLHMTATPIPRTLALTAYGDLDATVLRELPRGRRPVETHVVHGERARRRAYERIREEIAKGRQCFVVCPLVEESEALQAKAATAEYERLRETEFRDQRVALIHGQLPTSEKQKAMKAFAAGEADVLVATSVIEVGIDVPNASVILIEAAERYGLSQLHQLRGRVGRGEHSSLCILFGDPKLPRLAAIARESDGFRLAEIDLELRGRGEVLGTRQHGEPEFRVARLPDDQELLERAAMRAARLLDGDPLLEQPEHALLRDAVAARFDPELDPVPT
jgi:ATP-dependent DNA helicase RecG